MKYIDCIQYKLYEMTIAIYLEGTTGKTVVPFLMQTII